MPGGGFENQLVQLQAPTPPQTGGTRAAPMTLSQIINDPLYGYQMSDLDLTGYQAFQNTRRHGADISLEDYARQVAFEKRYQESPEFKTHVNDNRGSSNFLDRIGNAGQSFLDVTGDAIEGGAPFAALVAGGMALNGLGAAASGGAASAAGSGAAGGGVSAGGAASAGLGASLHGTGAAVAPIGTAGVSSALPIAGGAAVAGGAASSNPITNAVSSAVSGGGVTGNSLLDNLLIGGSSLASGLISNEATDRGIDEISRQFDLTRADQEPFRQAGVTALGQLQEGINEPQAEFEFSLQEDPGFNFARDQALQATERGAAARGFNLSGNVLNELNDRAVGVASQHTNDAFNRQLGTFNTNRGINSERLNRLAALAGVGQTAVNNTGQLGANASSNLANLHLQQGAGINNAIQGGLNNYLLNNYLQR